MDRRLELGRIVAALGEYYDKPLSETQLRMYVEDLLELEPHVLVAAIRQYRSDPGNDRFPLPAKLVALSRPGADLEAEAIEASNRIVQAMARFGWNNLERAREFIGELGWRVVEREGGWEQICRSVDDDNLGMFKAQWRQLAHAQLRRGRAGLDDRAPSLPRGPGAGPAGGGGLTSFADVLKQLPKPEGTP